MCNVIADRNRKAVFLVILDGSEECTSAIDYASDFASAEEGHVALLHVIESMPVQNWSDIEQRVQKELRSRAEQMIWDGAGRVIENTNEIPMVCIEEGDRSDVIINILEENPNIAALVLAVSSNSSKPGSLVSYFSGKGLARLKVPLMIVPSEHD